MRIKDFLYEYERVPMAQVEDPLGGSDPDPTASLAPGIEEPAPEPEAVPTPDAALNTDMGTPPPTSVPYDRFREVNEARKAAIEAAAPLQEFEQLGYPVEDLQRLVQWETEFAQDPVQAWLATAQSIDELPDGIKEAIAAHTGQPVVPVAPSTTPDPEPEPTASVEAPEWAKPLIEDKERRDREAQEAAELAQAEAARSEGKAALDSITEAWKKMDEKDGIATPEKTMLAHIVSASRVTTTPADALALARQEYLESREEMLGAVITRPGQTVRAVPGSRLAPQVPTVPRQLPRTLREASKLSEATWGEQVAE